MCHHASTTLPCALTSVRIAREWLRAELVQMYPGLRATTDDATLIVSELVTNCVRAVAHEFTVDVEGHRDRVKVSTTDDAPGMPTAVTDVDPTAESGRGLTIIAALATQWGVEPSTDRKTVWADLPLPADARPTFACTA